MKHIKNDTLQKCHITKITHSKNDSQQKAHHNKTDAQQNNTQQKNAWRKYDKIAKMTHSQHIASTGQMACLIPSKNDAGQRTDNFFMDPELKTLKWWISRLMLKLLVLLNPRLV